MSRFVIIALFNNKGEGAIERSKRPSINRDNKAISKQIDLNMVCFNHEKFHETFCISLFRQLQYRIHHTQVSKDVNNRAK